MNTEKIEKLAEEVFKAEECFKALGMANSFGLEYEERKAQSIAYALAETRMFEARQALRAEQGL